MLNLSPSLMCADQGYFAEEVKQLEAAGATTFHMDIMDGEFAPTSRSLGRKLGIAARYQN